MLVNLLVAGISYRKDMSINEKAPHLGIYSKGPQSDMHHSYQSYFIILLIIYLTIHLYNRKGALQNPCCPSCRSVASSENIRSQSRRNTFHLVHMSYSLCLFIGLLFILHLEFP